MNVFISWSGPSSQQFATALRDWLPDVLQAVKPWVSSEDIDKGTFWNAELSGKLQEVRFGIICVTPDNAVSPWLAFEAGAMSVNKGIGKQHVVPILIGLKKEQVTGPLSQFQMADCNAKDMLALMRTLNKALHPDALSEDRLDRSFERGWPSFESQMDSLLRSLDVQEEGSARRPVPDMLAELVELGRAHTRNLLNVQIRLDREHKQYAALAHGGIIRRKLHAPEFTHEKLDKLRADFANLNLTQFDRPKDIFPEPSKKAPDTE
jgi:hypothetical protein